MKLKIFIFLLLSLFLRPAAAAVDISTIFTPLMNNWVTYLSLDTSSSARELYCNQVNMCSTYSSIIEVPLELVPRNEIPEDNTLLVLPSFYEGITLTLNNNTATHTYMKNTFIFNAVLVADGSDVFPLVSSSNCFVSRSGASNYLFIEGSGDLCRIKFQNTSERLPIIKSIIYQTSTSLNPLDLYSGNYTGSFSIPINFGDNYQSMLEPGNEIMININLDVQHELKINPISQEDRNVTLQPCAKDQVCTPAQGEQNWERWMVSRVTPVLTGRSNFNLSTSTSFIAYLECSEQVDSHCAIKNADTGQQIPVKTSLSLENAANVTLTGGEQAVKIPLSITKDTATTFIPKMFNITKGSIDFLVEQADVREMLESTGRSGKAEVYEGSVTIMLEPVIN